MKIKKRATLNNPIQLHIYLMYMTKTTVKERYLFTNGEKGKFKQPNSIQLYVVLKYIIKKKGNFD